MSEQEGVPGAAGQGAGTEVEQTTPPPASPEPFWKSLKNPELRGYAEVKGFKGADAVEYAETILDSYRNLEKLRGVPQERLLTLPENMEDKEALRPILEKLGYAPPKEAGEYNFAAIENMDPARAAELQDIAFKHGVPAKVAAAVMADIAASEKAMAETMLADDQAEVAAEMGRLQAKWGAQFEAKREVASRAVRQFGFTEDELTHMASNIGAAAMYERFEAIGRSLGESGFIEGRKPEGFAMTPDGARAQLDTLMSDREFAAKFLNGDKASAERVATLNRIISGGQAAGGR